jgi:hypothetical protein
LQKQNATTFYFIKGSDTGQEVSVTCTATVNGKTVKNTGKIKVFQPKVNSFTSQWSSAPPQPWAFRYNGWLMFGDVYGSPGITWTAKVEAPTIGTGDIAFTQLVSTVSSKTIDAGAVKTANTNGAYVLDDAADIQYAGSVSITGGGGETTLSKPDSPTAGLGGSRYWSIQDSFKTYLMYRPTNGIWVTLQMLPWSESVTVTKTAGVWTIGGSPPASGGTGPSGNNSSELPLWTDSISRISQAAGL